MNVWVLVAMLWGLSLFMWGANNSTRRNTILNRTSLALRRNDEWQLARLERKIDLILDHLDIKVDETAFDVVLSAVPSSQKIAVLKAIREITGLGLAESKKLIESAPVVLQEGLPPEPAEALKQKLEAAGAHVTLMPRA
ncbi:MAG TPA: ribosomal protein L7/L12 [Crinalium sp.]|jgi:large subunit ribosomal protein L7/L12